MDGRVFGRPWSFGGNSQEWNFCKFVFKAYVGVVAPPKLTTIERAADDGSDKSAGDLRGRPSLTRETEVPAGTSLWTTSATHDELGGNCWFALNSH